MKIAKPKKRPPRPVWNAKPVDVPIDRLPQPTIDLGPNDGVYSDSRINPILKRLKLDKWISTFHEHSIDLDSLMELNEDDMKELGMRIGEKTIGALSKGEARKHKNLGSECKEST